MSSTLMNNTFRTRRKPAAHTPRRPVRRAAAAGPRLLERLEGRRMLAGDVVQAEDYTAGYQVAAVGDHVEGTQAGGKWLRLDGVDFGAGTDDAEVRYGSGVDGAILDVMIEDTTSPHSQTIPIHNTRARKVGNVTLTATGGDDTFSDKPFTLDETVAGGHDVFLVSKGNHDIGHLDQLTIGDGGTGGGGGGSGGTLYQETFDEAAGSHSGSLDPTGTWNGNVKGNTGVSGGGYTMADTTGVAFWYTSQLDVSAASGDVEVKLDVAAVGTPSGTFRAYLKQGGQTLATYRLNPGDAIPTGSVSLGTADPAAGDVQVEVHVDSATGGYRIDNVRVTGSTGSTGSTGGGGGGGGGGGQPGWQVVWQDEFNASAGSGLDLNKWRATEGYGWTKHDGNSAWGSDNGWGNQELGYNTGRPENVQHDGQGNLKLTARADNYSVPGNPLSNVHGYTAARIESVYNYSTQYGRIEARMKVADQDGMWTAFWTLGEEATHQYERPNGPGDASTPTWPYVGELDIVEVLGTQSDNWIQGNAHGPKYNSPADADAAGDNSWASLSNSGRLNAANFGGGTTDVGDGFHRYAIEWEPDEVRWYFDDIHFHTITLNGTHAGTPYWVFDEQPHFLLFSLSVSDDFGRSSWGGQSQKPDPSFTADSTLIDWVRVSKPVT